mgnify:CR=1 FL=1
MDIIDRVRQKILRFLRLDRLPGNPNSDRLTYINDPEALDEEALSEARVWYLGDSNELLNYYTQRAASGFAENQTYDRNRANYFWGISPTEGNIKRVHSGVPRAIVDTLAAAVGRPKVSAPDGSDLGPLLGKCGFWEQYSQRQVPMTLAEGWGCWRFSVPGDSRLGDWPMAEFCEARDVEFAVRSGRTIGAIFKSYYREGGKDYVLLETRRVNERGNSAIEYSLYRLGRNDEATPCPLSEVRGLEGLRDVEFPGLRRMLAVPCRFYLDPDRPGYGRSVYAGRYDLFDDLDQSLSQRSQTSRVSTPVEYYSPDVLERDGRTGEPRMPKVYNRQYVMKSGIPDGDGRVDNSIQTTQPALNFDQYSQEQRAILDMILTGLLSPATMGIDVAKKDNADAQREKEKITLMTRDTIVASEEGIVAECALDLAALKVYMDSGSIPTSEPSVSVKFPGFANPSFESQAQTLLPLWQAGAISDGQFVERLYGDGMSPEEKGREVEAIARNREAEQASVMGELGFDGDNGFGRGHEGQGAGGGGDGVPSEGPDGQGVRAGSLGLPDQGGR